MFFYDPDDLDVMDCDQGSQVMFFNDPYPFLWHTVAYIARPRAPSSTAAMLRKLVTFVVIYAFATIINISHVFAKLSLHHIFIVEQTLADPLQWRPPFSTENIYKILT